MNLESICEKVMVAAHEVGAFIKSSRDSALTVEEKSLNSLVTHVDKSAEEQLVQKLSKILPQAGIIGEEGIANNTSEDLNWIIDPLDGTTNYIHQVPCYSISIALMNAEEVLVGVVYEINLNECFYAWKDGGAYLDGKAISVSTNNQLSNALIATGFPYYDFDKLDAYMDLIKEFIKSTRGLRRLGSAAVDLAYVACGRFDGYFEYSLNSWDVAAGALLVQEAGGKVCDFNGGPDYIFGKEIIASSNSIHLEFYQTIKQYL